jgi:hypothetical protein
MTRTLTTLAVAALLSGLAVLPLAAQEYYSDIRPMLVENCLSCHTAEGPGWSMEDAQATYERRHMIAAMVLERMMPPWIAEGGHQEYMGDPTLSAAVLQMVRDWRDGGYEVGEPRPDVEPVPAEDHHGHPSFTPDFSMDIFAGASYLPEQSRADDYRCFVVDWPEDEPGYVTGFRARPGNLGVAHHVVVYAATPEMADRFRELSEGEDGMGYQCFGGAVPDRLGQRAEREAYEARYPDGVRELDRNSFWLAHWAPGMDGHQFPEGTGILVEPGAALIVQMHYYSADAPGQEDAGTLMDFRLARQVERPAFHFPQTRGDWLAAERNETMVIQPGTMATYEVADDLEALLPYISRVTQVDEEEIEALEIHSVNLHMHAFGHSGKVTLRDGTGRKDTLLSVPRWDLHWQRDFSFVEPKVFARDELRGTSLAVECTFRNHTNQVVYGGFGSYDEMCFNFSYIALQLNGAELVGQADGR